MLNNMTVNASVRVPLLIVFGLDYTFWPYWLDTQLSSPFSKYNEETIIDTRGKIVRYYPEVPKVLEKLSDDARKVAITSQTTDTKGTLQLLELLEWDKYIEFAEIYPAESKALQFQELHKKTKINYKDMLFFDDMRGALYNATQLGVFGVVVGRQGMNLSTLEDGLQQFASGVPKEVLKLR